MSTLKKILQQHATTGRGFKLGDDSAQQAQQMKLLQAQLQHLTTRNSRVFWAFTVAAVLVFAAAVWFVLQNLSDPDRVQTVFGACGVSLGGIIYSMHQLWKEKNTAEMVTALLGVLEKDQVSTVLNALLAKL